jgi:hypothetical protein
MKHIISILAGLALTLGLLLGVSTSASAAPVAPAKSLISHDLAIKASPKNDRSGLAICDHWGASNGETQGSGCSLNGSTTHYKFLDNGNWSDRAPINWDDTDGYYVPKGCRMREDVVGVDFKLNGYHNRGVWHKVSPSIRGYGIDHTRWLYLQCR